MKSKWPQALVVSNDAARRKTLEFNLAKNGFMVIMAMDANEGFRIAEKQHFDLVITDFRTPQGTGVDLIRQLRFLGPFGKTPMILLADEHERLDVEFLRDELWALVIREPCNLVEVVEKLAAFFSPEMAAC